MSEDKMKADFDRWIFDPTSEGYPLRHTNAAWYAWKACVAIKDAEIAEIRENQKILESDYVERVREVVALNLMIRDLREVIKDVSIVSKTYEESSHVYWTCPSCEFNEGYAPEVVKHSPECQLNNALAKSDHHNSRALEKMLLEAESTGLQFAFKATYPYSSDSDKLVNKILEVDLKLAELNKE